MTGENCEQNNNFQGSPEIQIFVTLLVFIAESSALFYHKPKEKLNNFFTILLSLRGKKTVHLRANDLK